MRILNYYDKGVIVYDMHIIMNGSVTFIRLLALRRVQLGMSYQAVARRSQLPVVTVNRILTGAFRDPSFPKVAAIAEALGMPLEAKEIPIRELQERQARLKARSLVRMVQATSGLEEQAVGAAAREDLEEQLFHELLAGPRRKLWSE